MLGANGPGSRRDEEKMMVGETKGKRASRKGRGEKKTGKKRRDDAGSVAWAKCHQSTGGGGRNGSVASISHRRLRKRDMSISKRLRKEDLQVRTKVSMGG